MNKTKKSEKKPKGDVVLSQCKNFATNPFNVEYFVQPEVINILNSNKTKVYQTFAEFENTLVSELNALCGNIKYKA